MGYVQVPYLLDTKIKVTFDGITLNTERQLIAGKLVTTYDKFEKNIFEIPIIGTVENAIETLKNIFREQKNKKNLTNNLLKIK